MTTVNTWLRQRRRRAQAPGIRKVYPARNVIDLANWRWAQAVKNHETASNKLKLAKAEVRAIKNRILDVHSPLVELIVSEVVLRLRKSSRRTPNSEPSLSKKKKSNSRKR